MKPALHHVGESRSPVVTVDGFSGQVAGLTDLAAAMAPFPADHGTYYPGGRRIIAPGDGEAYARVEAMLEDAAPFIGGAFGWTGFDLIEASFSMVTALPERLDPAQRIPHFDSTDPAYLALLLYLSPTEGTGFYRQRLTGIETVTDTNQRDFIAAARRESMVMRGYIRESGAMFEQIGRVEGVPDRLAIYQGCLLHSGIIPAGMRFSDDPRQGRLTLNIFVRGH